MNVTVKTNNGVLKVSSPFNTIFTKEAKALAGKWNPAGSTWDFDSRNETAVKALLQNIYGTDGSNVPDLVSVRWHLRDIYAAQKPLVFCGRIVATATGRDSGAKLGAGVVLLSGRITSDGSMKNWCTQSVDAVVLLHDIPRHLAIEMIEQNPEDVSVEAPATASIDRGALASERERLVARITEIDEKLEAA